MAIGHGQRLAGRIGDVGSLSTAGNEHNRLIGRQAWSTITKVNASIFLPGVYSCFMAARLFSGAIVSPSAGTPARPITFGSYGGGRATISSSTSNGFTSTNQDGIIVRDLIFTGSVSTNCWHLITNTAASENKNIQVIDCTVSSYGYDGIRIEDRHLRDFIDVLIQGCTVSGCTTQPSGHGQAGTALLQ